MGDWSRRLGLDNRRLGGVVINVVEKLVYAGQVHRYLDILTERERRVITLRFGIADGRSRSLEEVGKEFEVTRERIRQIEVKALRKLQEVDDARSDSEGS